MRLMDKLCTKRRNAASSVCINAKSTQWKVALGFGCFCFVLSKTGTKFVSLALHDHTTERMFCRFWLYRWCVSFCTCVWSKKQTKNKTKAACWGSYRMFKHKCIFSCWVSSRIRSTDRLKYRSERSWKENRLIYLLENPVDAKGTSSLPPVSVWPGSVRGFVTLLWVSLCTLMGRIRDYQTLETINVFFPELYATNLGEKSNSAFLQYCLFKYAISPLLGKVYNTCLILLECTFDVSCQ